MVMVGWRKAKKGKKGPLRQHNSWQNQTSRKGNYAMKRQILEACLQYEEARQQRMKPGTVEHTVGERLIAVCRERLLALEVGYAGGCPGSIIQHPTHEEENSMAMNVSETIVDTLLATLDHRGHIDLFHNDDYLPTREALVREVGGILTAWQRVQDDADA